MQKHQRNPEYALTLPAISIKKKSLKKLEAGDILLLALDHLLLLLVQENEVCASLSLDSYGDRIKMTIDKVEKSPLGRCDNKKYETVLCSFGKVQSRVLELGHSIEIPALDFNHLTLHVNDKIIASGSLINVDDEIAIKITEVNDG